MNFDFPIPWPEGQSRAPCSEVGACIATWSAAEVRRLTAVDYHRLRAAVERFGQRSARAQGLAAPVTSVERLLSSDQRLLLCQPAAGSSRLLGGLKIGHKRLFIRRDNGALVEMEPLCVLDVYVHESVQRSGLGRALMDAALRPCVSGAASASASASAAAARVAYDRPSPKLLSFLSRHFGLSRFVPQSNNFVVFDRYFEAASGGGGASRGVGGGSGFDGRGDRRQGIPGHGSSGGGSGGGDDGGCDGLRRRHEHNQQQLQHHQQLQHQQQQQQPDERPWRTHEERRWAPVTLERPLSDQRASAPGAREAAGTAAGAPGAGAPTATWDREGGGGERRRSGCLVGAAAAPWGRILSDFSSPRCGSGGALSSSPPLLSPLPPRSVHTPEDNKAWQYQQQQQQQQQNRQQRWCGGAVDAPSTPQRSVAPSFDRISVPSRPHSGPCAAAGGGREDGPALSAFDGPASGYSTPSQHQHHFHHHQHHHQQQQHQQQQQQRSSSAGAAAGATAAGAAGATGAHYPFPPYRTAADGGINWGPTTPTLANDPRGAATVLPPRAAAAEELLPAPGGPPVMSTLHLAAMRERGRLPPHEVGASLVPTASMARRCAGGFGSSRSSGGGGGGGWMSGGSGGGGDAWCRLTVGSPASSASSAASAAAAKTAALAHRAGHGAASCLRYDVA